MLVRRNYNPFPDSFSFVKIGKILMNTQPPSIIASKYVVIDFM